MDLDEAGRKVKNTLDKLLLHHPLPDLPVPADRYKPRTRKALIATNEHDDLLVAVTLMALQGQGHRLVVIHVTPDSKDACGVMVRNYNSYEVIEMPLGEARERFKEQRKVIAACRLCWSKGEAERIGLSW